MAISFTLDQFAKRMEFRSKEAEMGYNKSLRLAATAAMSAAVVGTPFDTGQAKNNWFVAIGTPDVKSLLLNTENIGDNTQAVIFRGSGTIRKWKLNAGDLFISNNLHYILALERGHSQKAPEGMAKQAIFAAKQVLIRAKILKD